MSLGFGYMSKAIGALALPATVTTPPVEPPPEPVPDVWEEDGPAVGTWVADAALD